MKTPSAELEVTTSGPPTDELAPTAAGFYRLYDRRWVGVFAMFMLEAMSAASWPWFGPISNKVVRDFGFTLNEVNWMGNIIACVYLPMAFLTPIVIKRYGLKRCRDVATILLLLSGWIRYAGTARSLSKGGAYALIILGQAFSGVSSSLYHILAPKYSERWFDRKDRTTATMITFIAYPIGGALGQVLSPPFSDTRKSILLLAIMSTAVIPIGLVVPEAPPVPPSHSGSCKPPPSAFALLRASVGLSCPPESYMTLRERFCFGLLVFVFSSVFAAFNTFPILSSQWLSPYGYSDTISGLIGAVMLLSGVVAAISITPILDRILTRHLGTTRKLLFPFIAGSWLSLIWAVKSNNTAALFVIFVVIGVCSIPFLVVGIELGVALTKNPDESAYVLWFFGNVISIVFVLVQSALRASPNESPPLNMHHAIIFNSDWVVSGFHFVFIMGGKQVRRGQDERTDEEQRTQGTRLDDIATLSPQEGPSESVKE